MSTKTACPCGKQRQPEKEKAYYESRRDSFSATQKKYAESKGIEWRYNRSLLYKHGITINDYYEMLEEQNGVCAGCGADEPGYNQKFFCVDHNHVDGRIRGLLCGPCNLALGKLKDNPTTIRTLADYVEAKQ